MYGKAACPVLRGGRGTTVIGKTYCGTAAKAGGNSNTNLDLSHGSPLPTRKYGSGVPMLNSGQVVWLVNDRPQAVLEAVENIFLGTWREEGAVDQVGCSRLAGLEMLDNLFGAAGLDAVELSKFHEVRASVEGVLTETLGLERIEQLQGHSRFVGEMQ